MEAGFTAAERRAEGFAARFKQLGNDLLLDLDHLKMMFPMKTFTLKSRYIKQHGLEKHPLCKKFLTTKKKGQ